MEGVARNVGDDFSGLTWEEIERILEANRKDPLEELFNFGSSIVNAGAGMTSLMAELLRAGGYYDQESVIEGVPDRRPSLEELNLPGTYEWAMNEVGADPYAPESILGGFIDPVAQMAHIIPALRAAERFADAGKLEKADSIRKARHAAKSLSKLGVSEADIRKLTGEHFGVPIEAIPTDAEGNLSYFYRTMDEGTKAIGRNELAASRVDIENLERLQTQIGDSHIIGTWADLLSGSDKDSVRATVIDDLTRAINEDSARRWITTPDGRFTREPEIPITFRDADEEGLYLTVQDLVAGDPEMDAVYPDLTPEAIKRLLVKEFVHQRPKQVAWFGRSWDEQTDAGYQWLIDYKRRKAKDAQKLIKSAMNPTHMEARLPDVYAHPELYDLVPELRDAMVHYRPKEEMPHAAGTWHTGSNRMSIRNDNRGDFGIHTLAHEVEHGVQEHTGMKGSLAGYGGEGFRGNRADRSGPWLQLPDGSSWSMTPLMQERMATGPLRKIWRRYREEIDAGQPLDKAVRGAHRVADREIEKFRAAATVEEMPGARKNADAAVVLLEQFKDLTRPALTNQWGEVDDPVYWAINETMGDMSSWHTHWNRSWGERMAEQAGWDIANLRYDDPPPAEALADILRREAKVPDQSFIHYKGQQ